MEASEKRLTVKQQAFVEAYVGEARGNATESARIAGYSGNRHTLEEIGSQNLRKLEISQEIKRVLSERTLTAEQVLGRLTEHANGTLQPFLFLSGDRIVIDLDSEEAKPYLHLLKKAKQKVRRGGKDENAWEEVETEIELHDVQNALVQLGRYHKLFTERLEHTGKDGKPIQLEGITEYRDLPPDEVIRRYREALGNPTR